MLFRNGWTKLPAVQFEVEIVSHQPRTGKTEALHRRERRQWLAGTALMAVLPLRFAAAALTDPAPLDPTLVQAIHSAILTPPDWLTQLIGPIDLALRNSGPTVLPALVMLVLLLRLWVNYGRRLFKPLAALPTA
jgi:hypothetical protein